MNMAGADAASPARAPDGDPKMASAVVESILAASAHKLTSSEVRPGHLAWWIQGSRLVLLVRSLLPLKDKCQGVFLCIRDTFFF